MIDMPGNNSSGRAWLRGFSVLVPVGMSVVLAGCSLQRLFPQPNVSGSPDHEIGTPGPEDGVLIAVGDIGVCGVQYDEATAALVETIPGTVAGLGDMVYDDGTAEEFEACYEPGWGRHRERTRPTPGNHEYFTENGAPYFTYFGEAAGAPGEGWYSYELGAWHIVVLNSNCEQAGGCNADSPQGQWLRADLEANQAECTLAYWHHPRYSQIYGQDDRSAYFWELLAEHGAEVILNGHDHHYVRHAPLDAEGRVDRQIGIRQFIVGTGGAPLYDFDQLPVNVEARNQNTYGVLMLLLHPTSYEWEFIPLDGSAFTDSGSEPCHQPPIPAQPH